jgi:ficolin
MKFSTADMDQDTSDDGNCAELHNGGWWFNRCVKINLNGLYLGPSTAAEKFIGINWFKWHGQYYSLKRTEMKIKPLV